MNDALPSDAKPIPGFGGYFATPGGEIWSTKRATPLRLSASPSQRYLQVLLCVDRTVHQRKVHHLVLESLVGPRPIGALARHLNGNRFDNRSANLAWGTAQENSDDKVMHGTMAWGNRNGRSTHPEATARGERQWNAKLTAEKVREIRRRAADGSSESSLARKYGVYASTIARVVARRTWAHVV